MIEVPSVVLFFAAFVLVALASKQIGRFFSKYGLPYITGYLLAGMLAGPFILQMLPAEATSELRFIDDVSLAVIAFIAGSELYLKELRGRLRGILLNTGGIVLAGLILIGVAVLLLTYVIPFTQDLSMTARIATAVLGGTVLLALSPPSTIAVIQEVRARGPFTKTVLSVTVVMDVVIIVLFAISTATAAALLDGGGLQVSFILTLAIDLALATAIGLIVARIIERVLATHWPRPVKTTLILVLGTAMFAASFWVDQQKLGFHLEPLLQALIVGFFITNFTAYRDEFEDILHDVSPWIYVAFFTLTGVALKLDVLIASGLFALVLFGVRIGAILIGSFIGGTAAGESMQFRRYAWLGLVTQAGIALGLSREVAVLFPDTLGDSFATLIISVIVLNEIFGPMFLKFALRRVGESHEPGKPEEDEVRDAVILGVESMSVALARLLTRQNWCVIVADTDRSHIERISAEDLDERYIERIDEKTMGDLITPSTDAVVAMMEDDEANYRALEIAYERFGIQRLVVRLSDRNQAERFQSIGALVVDPTSAVVNLLDQYVRAPQSASWLMHRDPDHDMIQVTVTEPDVHGVPLRDLRLPNDVLVLEVYRNGVSIMPAGYTDLHLRDEVTLLGKPESLQEAIRRLGY